MCDNNAEVGWEEYSLTLCWVNVGIEVEVGKSTAPEITQDTETQCSTLRSSSTLHTLQRDVLYEDNRFYRDNLWSWVEKKQLKMPFLSCYRIREKTKSANVKVNVNVDRVIKWRYRLPKTQH